MSATIASTLTPPFATVLLLEKCSTDSELLVAGETGAVLGANVTIREQGSDDFAILEADSPEQLERLAAELVVAAQTLREARAIKAGKVGHA